MIFVLCFRLGAQSGFPFEISDDLTLNSEILIDCQPVLDSVPLNDGDYIVLIEDSVIVSAIPYNKDSVLRLRSTYKSNDSYANYEYAVYKPDRDSCLYPAWANYDQSLEILDSTSRVINMEATAIDFRYEKEKICADTDMITPLVSGNMSGRLNFSYRDGLNMDSQGNIYPLKSIPGDYSIKISSDYCLKNNIINVSVVVPEQIDPIIKYTLCPGESLDDIDLNGAFVDSMLMGTGTETEIKYNIIREDHNGCELSQVVEINYAKPEPILLDEINYCDKTILIPLKEYNWDPTDVSLQNVINNGFQFQKDTNLLLSIYDSNNCLSYKEYPVKIKRLSIQNLEYSLEESSCWEYGKIKINNVNVLNAGNNTINYKLKNTITGAEIALSNETELIEGIYKFRVESESGCREEYTQEIVLMKECLDNFPVFAPSGLNGTFSSANTDNTFFIPYEGTVSIYNRNGRIIKKLETPAYWDGKDNGNNTVPMGNYIMVTDKGKVVNITVVR